MATVRPAPLAPDARRRTVAALAATALGLTYISLYPFDFAAPPSPGVWQSVDLTAPHSWFLTDGMANFLLFVPFGLLAGALQPTERGWGLILILAEVLLFAFLLQQGQRYLPGRIPSGWDVVMNTCGAMAGALLAAGGRGRSLAARPPAAAVILPALLVAAWPASQLFPLVPLAEWEEVTADLRGLAEPWPWSHLAFLVALSAGAGWVHAASRLGLPRPAILGAALAAGLVAGKVVLPQRSPELELLAGGLAGAGLAAALTSARPRARTLLALTAAAVAAEALAPLAFLPMARDFHWLPFHGFLAGSPGPGAIAALEKVFAYGLLWLLLRDSGVGRVTALAAGAGGLAAIEWTQRWLGGGHIAESTDPLLFAGLAAVFWRLSAGGFSRTQGLAD